MLDELLGGGGKKEEDRDLSESHRLLYKIARRNIVAFFAFVFIGSLAYFLFFGEIYKNFLYTKEDRVALATIEEYKENAIRLRREGKISEKTLFEYSKLLEEKRKEIEDKYPGFVVPLASLSKYQGNKIVFAFVFYLIPLLLLSSAYFYIIRDLKKERDFFYQYPQKEPIVPFKKEIKLRAFLRRKIYKKELLDRFFVDLDLFMRALEYSLSEEVGFDEQKAFKIITDLLKKAEKFISVFYPHYNKVENYLRIEIILWHHIASLYGNLPTGIAAKTVKDYTAKKMLTLYARKQLPVLYSSSGEFLEKDYEAYVCLTILYSLDKKYDFFKTLSKELDPVPMLSPLLR